MCRDQPIMLLFSPIMLCCSALKIYLLCSILCSVTKIAVRVLCYLCKSLQEQLITCSRTFLERLFYFSLFAKVKIRYNLNHTVTVLLEYVDGLSQVSIK